MSKIKIDRSNDTGSTIYHMNYLVENFHLLGNHFKVVIPNDTTVPNDNIFLS